MRKKRGSGSGSGLWIVLVLLIIFGSRWLFPALRFLITAVGIAILAVVAYFIVKAVKSSKEEKSAQPAVTGREPDVGKKSASQRVQTIDTAVRKEQQVRPVKPETPKYSPEVQAVVDEGKKAHRELEHLYAVIPDLNVKHKILEIMDVSDKIVQDAVDDPSDVPQIKKFLDYYLPTTIKLLNAYDRMGAQGIEGENITGTMHNIEEMLDSAIVAYKKLLDSLFANQALDIDTDISVMNTLLKREGLAGSDGVMAAAGGH